MKKILSILTIITLAALLAVPATAETINGTLGGSDQFSVKYTGSSTGTQGGVPFSTLVSPSIEYAVGTTALVSFDSGRYPQFDANAPTGASTTYTGHLDSLTGPVVTSGTIGYQRIFKNGVEQLGYQYVTFDRWNLGTASGSHKIFLDYDRSKIYNIAFSIQSTSYPETIGTGNLAFLNSNYQYPNCVMVASYVRNGVKTVLSEYSITKPAGIGISGTVKKLESSTSVIAITDEWGNILTQQKTVGPETLEFTVTDQPIIVAMQSSTGTWYNSSVLLKSAVKYTLAVTPETGTTTTAYSAKSTADSGVAGATLDAFTVVCNSGTVSGKCLSNSTDPTFIKKTDGYWYQADANYQYSIKWAAFPAILPLTFDAPGTYTVKAVYYPVGLDGVSAQDTVTVDSVGTTRKLTVQVQDYASGALISDAAVQIINSAGTWSNATTTGGVRTYSARNGEYIGIAASAPGYLDSSLTYSQIARDTTKTIILSKYIEVPAGNNTLYVYTRDSSTHNTLEGALVRLNDGQTKTTPGSGLATFTVLEGGTYQITVSKSGYHTLTRTLIVAGSANAISMEVSPLYITTAPTLAPGETATPTPLPTVDTRTDAQKDRAMMSLIRDNAEALILVAIVMTFLYLVGYKP